MAKDTILVIDDNRTFCNYLCSILESKASIPGMLTASRMPLNLFEMRM